MISKYLYCKYSNLEGFIRTGKWLRFTDINQYINRENETIRDNESERAFEFTSKTIKRITDKNGTLTGNDFRKVTITLKTRRCHVLCLSNKKDDEDLFRRFNADTCIELNVEELLNILDDFFKKRVTIIAKNVDYFDIDTGVGGDRTDLVFQKHASFKIEDEYRIALFYPFGERSLLIKDGEQIKVFGDNGYIGIGINDPMDLNNIIVKVSMINT